MALTINTNIFSVNAQRNLQKSESPLQTALQRLSTGYRINSAKDDAAGYAIVARQTLQVSGLGVAIRNSNDGISFAQTAEGAMEEMITALQRVNELALQSASNNTAIDRTSLNNEVSQLVAELNRIVGQTRYNGETFLDRAKSINIQVGTNVNETINVSTQNVSPTTTGVSTTYGSTQQGSDAALSIARSALSIYSSGGLGNGATIEGVSLSTVGITTATDYQNNSVNILSRVNQFTGTTGVTGFNFGNALVASGNATIATTAQSTSIVDSGYLTINGIAIGSFTLASGAGAVATDGAQVALTNLAGAINAKASTTGVYAYLVQVTSDLAANRLVLANTTGAGIDVSVDLNVANASLIVNDPFASGTTSVSANQNGQIILNASVTKTSLNLGTNQTFRALGLAGAAADTLGTTVSLTANSVNSLNVSTAAQANVTILAVQSAIDVISSQKAKLGAVQNRLQTTISNLDNVRESATASRSRIRDTDFAEESSNLSKALIIQQAGISVLSQANSISQNVLALLQR